MGLSNLRYGLANKLVLPAFLGLSMAACPPIFDEDADFDFPPDFSVDGYDQNDMGDDIENDVLSDVGYDTLPDVVDDVSVDLPPNYDTGNDVLPDLSQDVSVDLPPNYDAGNDVLPDLVNDVSQDVGFDTLPDLVNDVGSDLEEDISQDVGVDLEADVAQDVIDEEVAELYNVLSIVPFVTVPDELYFSSNPLNCIESVTSPEMDHYELNFVDNTIDLYFLDDFVGNVSVDIKVIDDPQTLQQHFTNWTTDTIFFSPDSATYDHAVLDRDADGDFEVHIPFIPLIPFEDYVAPELLENFQGQYANMLDYMDKMMRINDAINVTRFRGGDYILNHTDPAAYDVMRDTMSLPNWSLDEVEVLDPVQVYLSPGLEGHVETTDAVLGVINTDFNWYVMTDVAFDETADGVRGVRAYPSFTYRQTSENFLTYNYGETIPWAILQSSKLEFSQNSVFPDGIMEELMHALGDRPNMTYDRWEADQFTPTQRMGLATEFSIILLSEERVFNMAELYVD